MRWGRSIPLALALLLLLACQAGSVFFARPSTVSISPTVFLETVRTPTAVLTPTPAPVPTEAPVSSQHDIPPATQMDETFKVRLHPDGLLYSGDQVSAEIIAPADMDINDLKVSVSLSGVQLGQAAFAKYGIGERKQATLSWMWDTSGLEAGDYPLVYTLLPGGMTFTETVTLLPSGQVPPPEPEAHWVTTTSDCCTLHYITGTAAQRDLDELEKMIDEQAQDVSRLLEADFEKSISIVLLPRVLGHGGFTSNEISVSYLDRNYAGSSPQIVLHHELVHALDSSLGGDLRPTLLLEGLAVYLSGGHFKPEPLMPRAAALLDLNLYLPLRPLADDFYPSQHEIGYLEAGALVEFMVDAWGWQGFSDFYRDIHPGPEGARQSQAISAALRQHFELSFDDLEERFLQALRAEQVTEDSRQDVRQTVRLYDAVRLYQQTLDPSAYFMTAWLPDGEQMRQRGIVADYLRHPESMDNLVVEAMLVSADAYLREGDYAQAGKYLDAIELTLALIQAGIPQATSIHPLAANYRALIELLQKRGFEAQRITITENKARVWATLNQGDTPGEYLTEFDLVRSRDGWTVLEQLNY
jgi:hypothetical protein